MSYVRVGGPIRMMGGLGRFYGGLGVTDSGGGGNWGGSTVPPSSSSGQATAEELAASERADAAMMAQRTGQTGQPTGWSYEPPARTSGGRLSSKQTGTCTRIRSGAKCMIWTGQTRPTLTGGYWVRGKCENVPPSPPNSTMCFVPGAAPRGQTSHPPPPPGGDRAAPPPEPVEASMFPSFDSLDTTEKWALGIGAVALAAGLGYYLWQKKKAKQLATNRRRNRRYSRPRALAAWTR